ncbi:dephospho-CoA kinase [Levilactobacillus senmaizukei DSM 21775 = NBRC 103853]|uniref:Dephospho-CoA kinase n=1 Tax=Levilactobacillus senmaizukei DSM 21775 = NBRC 103853 TaxID=1423803 RepID=A0A0R2DCL4_9LACO|nr:dephospho-CoA kinase [Levilactobacillus senmaizukei]KRN01598.1 dephospho-CoA kinase [Levilactobacillus senmaizukei DSM 21775 = NBRC 103853]
MTEVWGLTGGIATGKSTVSGWLKEAWIPVIDADAIAHEILAPGTPGLKSVITTFGTKYLQGTALNRRLLGQSVFKDPTALKQLEAITTPLIKAEIIRQLAQYRQDRQPLVVIDAPTLYEVGYLVTLVDHVAVVATTAAEQLHRLRRRDQLSAGDAQRRINSQWPIERKTALATLVIDNGGTIAETRAQVVKWLDMTNLGQRNPLK